MSRKKKTLKCNFFENSTDKIYRILSRKKRSRFLGNDLRCSEFLSDFRDSGRLASGAVLMAGQEF